MSEINTNKETQEDEISLLDLFAVLIRYRKLIVFGTLIVSFLAGLYLFVLPMVLKKAGNQSALVSYAVDVRNVPVGISEKLPNNEKITPLYLATYNSERLPFLVDQIKAHNIFSDTEMTNYEFNSFVQSLIKEKTIQIEASPLGNGYDIKIKVGIDRIDEATELVRSMVRDTEKSVDDYYLPLIETLGKNTTNSLEKATYGSTSDSGSVQALRDLAVEIDEFTQSFSGFLSLRDDPFVVPEGRGRVKKLMIIFFATFFVLVFIAFCRNSIANIKADPESNKLITEAWKAGK